MKQSDGEAPVILELWGMWSTPSLLLLPGPLWPRVEAPDRALSIGRIELTFKLCASKCIMINWIVWNRTVFTFKNEWCLIKLLVIYSNTWNYLTLLTYVYKSYISNIYIYIYIYIYMNKPDLALNNIQWLACHKTKLNQFTHSWEKYRWIHVFPKGISLKWNANCLVKDWNLDHLFHFLRQ